jgi:choline dehydrogenase
MSSSEAPIEENLTGRARLANNLGNEIEGQLGCARTPRPEEGSIVADYVIVGAGSAGCVLGSRLSEDPDVDVLLLEAGGPDTAHEIHVPAMFPLAFKSGLDWDLFGEQEPGLGGRRLYFPRGRVIGGSSSINAMIYLRGNRADFDEWAELGCTGWSYDEVLPYFKRSEDNERGENEFHGVGGPLAVSDGRSLSPLTDAQLEAATQAGYELIEDLNVDRPEGVARFQLTQRNGMRCSAADAFLHPAEGRPNLEVASGVFVERIVFDGDRAIGVELVRNGVRETVRAEHEVIVSAGTYQSPVLLMLSGIGPADDLGFFGIPVRENLPVGHNLQDHCMVNVNYLTDEPGLFGIFTPENFALLESEGRGPLTSNYPEGGGFFRTRSDLPAPDVEFHFAAAPFFDEGLSPPPDHGYAFGPVIIKPTSRGKVGLRTPMADSKPTVLCNFLTTDEDRASMLEGVRIALEIASQPALEAIKREPLSIPASDSENDIFDWVRRASQTVYHPTSTCAMGAVVDPELRVYGVEGLRVVDASVMPKITRANTNAATVMIAEKGADMILGKAPLAPATAATA